MKEQKLITNGDPDKNTFDDRAQVYADLINNPNSITLSIPANGTCKNFTSIHDVIKILDRFNQIKNPNDENSDLIDFNIDSSESWSQYYSIDGGYLEDLVNCDENLVSMNINGKDIEVKMQNAFRAGSWNDGGHIRVLAGIVFPNKELPNVVIIANGVYSSWDSNYWNKAEFGIEYKVSVYDVFVAKEDGFKHTGDNELMTHGGILND